MRALRLVFSLVLVPRLFLSILFFPLLIGLSVIVVQVLATGLFVTALTKEAGLSERESAETRLRDEGFVRGLLFPEGSFETITVCRWITTVSDDGRLIEMPPGPECQPDMLDVAIRVSPEADFDLAQYKRVFSGLVERIHLCSYCSPHIEVIIEPERVVTNSYSIWGLVISSLARFDPEVQDRRAEIRQEYESLRALLGDMYFYSDGLNNPVGLTEIYSSAAVLINILFLILIAVWLALKGHRKVLDYFVKNGALLPMVAAVGKRSFYAAIWMLTGIRVGFFLLAAMPVTYSSYRILIGEGDSMRLFNGDSLLFALWIASTAISLSLAALIASIADLKSRHSIISFAYKYLPLLLSFFGVAVWSATFLMDNQTFTIIRNLMVSLPVVGLGPVLLAPIFEPHPIVLLTHALLSLLLLLLCLKWNSEWFSAHLEEI